MTDPRYIGDGQGGYTPAVARLLYVDQYLTDPSSRPAPPLHVPPLDRGNVHFTGLERTRKVKNGRTAVSYFYQRLRIIHKYQFGSSND